MADSYNDISGGTAEQALAALTGDDEVTVRDDVKGATWLSYSGQTDTAPAAGTFWCEYRGTYFYVVTLDPGEVTSQVFKQMNGMGDALRSVQENEWIYRSVDTRSITRARNAFSYVSGWLKDNSESFAAKHKNVASGGSSFQGVTGTSVADQIGNDSHQLSFIYRELSVSPTPTDLLFDLRNAIASFQVQICGAWEGWKNDPSRDATALAAQAGALTNSYLSDAGIVSMDPSGQIYDLDSDIRTMLANFSGEINGGTLGSREFRGDLQDAGTWAQLNQWVIDEWSATFAKYFDADPVKSAISGLQSAFEAVHGKLMPFAPPPGADTSGGSGGGGGFGGGGPGGGSGGGGPGGGSGGGGDLGLGGGDGSGGGAGPGDTGSGDLGLGGGGGGAGPSGDTGVGSSELGLGDAGGTGLGGADLGSASTGGAGLGGAGGGDLGLGAPGVGALGSVDLGSGSVGTGTGASEGGTTLPDGARRRPDGTVTLPDGTTMSPDGTVTMPNGTTVSDGTTTLPDGTQIGDDGSVTSPDGTVSPAAGGTTTLPDGTTVSPDGTVRLPDGGTVSPDGTTTLPDGTTISDGTATLPDGSQIGADGSATYPDSSGAGGTTTLPHGTLADAGGPTGAGGIGDGSGSATVGTGGLSGANGATGSVATGLPSTPSSAASRSTPTSAVAPSSGMPYFPSMMGGMGGMGGMGSGTSVKRERQTWLTEDERVWGTKPSSVGPAVIGRYDDDEDYYAAEGSGAVADADTHLVGPVRRPEKRTSDGTTTTNGQEDP